MTQSYWIAYGCKTKDRAAEILEDMFAHGEISQCEAPQIVSYVTDGNRRFWGIVGKPL